MPSKPRKRSEALKEKIDEIKKNQEQKAIERRAYIKQCLNSVAGTEEGRVLFRELARLCSFRRSKIVADTVAHTVDNDSTAHNAAQELIYLNMTSGLRREYLIKIEHPAKDEI